MTDKEFPFADIKHTKKKKKKVTRNAIFFHNLSGKKKKKKAHITGLSVPFILQVFILTVF